MLFCSTVPKYVAEEDVWTYVSGGKGEWRTQHSEELRDLNSSSNNNRPFKTRGMRRGEHVARVGDTREGKRPLGRPRRRWENNIKTDQKKLFGTPWTTMIWFRIG